MKKMKLRKNVDKCSKVWAWPFLYVLGGAWHTDRNWQYKQ